jgi:hypothetical protein
MKSPDGGRRGLGVGKPAARRQAMKPSYRPIPGNRLLLAGCPSTVTLLIIILLSTTLSTPARAVEPNPISYRCLLARETGGAALAGYGIGAATLVGSYFLLFGPANKHDQEYGDLATIAQAITLTGLVAWPVGSALGACWVGDRYHQDGRFWPAVLGSECGVATACVFFYAGTFASILTRGSALIMVPFGLVAVAMPPIGAVAGYNLSRPRATRTTWIEQRLDMPRVAMTLAPDELNRPVPGLRCDIVNLKF